MQLILFILIEVIIGMIVEKNIFETQCISFCKACLLYKGTGLKVKSYEI